eukprot:6594561-Pyramimonas_sp.AAC.1
MAPGARPGRGPRAAAVEDDSPGKAEEVEEQSRKSGGRNDRGTEQGTSSEIWGQHGLLAPPQRAAGAAACA